MIARFFVNISPAVIKSVLPRYHPRKIDDPDWVSRWTAAYAHLPKNSISALFSAWNGDASPVI